ncbi:MAG: prepilin-type N-terminal cleavage/methylation domain-containing protein [Verrucomicrobiota bacterium]|nr:prepilin-type N-terminal cleavage/methylation domain-containing protein [Verrucomicrobiota bacterium]
MKQRDANWHRSGALGFTLIELMVVMGLMAIIIAIGVPRMVQGNRTPLGESLNVVMEACAAARRQAILSGRTTSMTIRPAEGDAGFTVTVGASGGSPRPSEMEAINNSGTEPIMDELSPPVPKPKGGAGFTGRIHDEVAIYGLFVNFKDMMDGDQEQAVVKFYSNGTTDEFTVAMRHEFGDQVLRFVQLDSVTGLAYMKNQSEIFLP